MSIVQAYVTAWSLRFFHFNVTLGHLSDHRVRVGTPVPNAQCLRCSHSLQGHSNLAHSLRYVLSINHLTWTPGEWVSTPLEPRNCGPLLSLRELLPFFCCFLSYLIFPIVLGLPKCQEDNCVQATQSRGTVNPSMAKETKVWTLRGVGKEKKEKKKKSRRKSRL